MTDQIIAKELIHANIEQEMRQSYLDYAMSVIVGRALPDVRDGLKPVHRRVLYAMDELGLAWNKPYKKSARVVGDVIGKYHPHGDTAVYDTIVRMAQDFSLRYPLIDGQGNFGSVDGDAPAAMRYTEIRLSRISLELLSDLGKETVDFGPNYDETETQPLVLPTRIPGLLVNGSSGIAVGMATNIPPHNLNEVVEACLVLIDAPETSIDELMEYIPGPDFPTSGIIVGTAGIREAYHTGRGRAYVRARTEIETNEKTGRQAIIVHELPYQVNKARLMEKIAYLVKNKLLEGISAIRDESDKDGMRMVVEIKRGEPCEVVLNHLYKQTQMQTVFGLNMVALENNQPKLFNLKEMLDAFLRHRREVVTRRTVYELKKLRGRAHILEGLAVALANIDEIIALIKAASSPAEAKATMLARTWQPGIVEKMLDRGDAKLSRPQGLSDDYGLIAKDYQLSPEQAQAILELRLHRLTGLEQDKIRSEYVEIIDNIVDLLDILENPDRLVTVIKDELLEVKQQYGDGRRTVITQGAVDISMEDLIAEEDVVVTISFEGYAKAQPVADYRAQRRGGRGKMATKTKEEDFVSRMFVANTHDTLLCFSSKGKVYWLKVFQLPVASRGARGKPLVNLLPLESQERITAVLPIRDYSEDQFIVMATANGTIKKSALMDYSRPRAGGIIALNLPEEDELIKVSLTEGNQHIMLVSSSGKAVRFDENDARPLGRTARGVRGIRLAEDHKVISMIILPGNGSEAIEGDVVDEDESTETAEGVLLDQALLFCTEKGYGKRTSIENFPVHRRGGQGVIAIKTPERNGAVVNACIVYEGDEVMMITDGGVLIRTRANEISVQGRNTQGVRVIALSEDEKLVTVDRVDEAEEDDETAEETAEGVTAEVSDETLDETQAETEESASAEEEE
ncbi:MAG: DNA gyrase subunit A [Arenicellales bacterium]